MKKSFFDLAKKIATKSPHPAHKLGCVIAKRSRIVSVGFNQLKTHPRSNNLWRTQHAEFSAILGVSVNDLKDSTVYVYRERKDGTLGLARPCETCYSMLKDVGVSEIYYSTYDGFKLEKL